MGNTSSERAAMGQGSDKAQRGGRERPKILMDSPEDADIFHSEDIKVSCAAFLARSHILRAYLCAKRAKCRRVPRRRKSFSRGSKTWKRMTKGRL